MFGPCIHFDFSFKQHRNTGICISILERHEDDSFYTPERKKKDRHEKIKIIRDVILHPN